MTISIFIKYLRLITLETIYKYNPVDKGISKDNEKYVIGC